MEINRIQPHYPSMVITARVECTTFCQHRKIFTFPHMVQKGSAENRIFS